MEHVSADCVQDSFTPLYMAAQIGQQEIVTLLLAHGADPTLTTKVNIRFRNLTVTNRQ